MRNFLQRFFAGRYGNDALNRFLMIVALLLILLSYIFDSSIFSLLAWVFLLLGFVRMLSRNIARRQVENMRYWELRNWFLHWVAPYRSRWRDRKTHRYFRCPRCNTMMRVPRQQGKIRITCRRCGHQFERTT